MSDVYSHGSESKLRQLVVLEKDNSNSREFVRMLKTIIAAHGGPKEWQFPALCKSVPLEAAVEIDTDGQAQELTDILVQLACQQEGREATEGFRDVVTRMAREGEFATPAKRGSEEDE